jgi:hypothetical protein
MATLKKQLLIYLWSFKLASRASSSLSVEDGTGAFLLYLTHEARV